MLKKLTSLCLSLVLCISLLSGQVCVINSLESSNHPVQTEILCTRALDGAQDLIAPAWAEEIPKTEGNEQFKE